MGNKLSTSISTDAFIRASCLRLYYSALSYLYLYFLPATLLYFDVPILCCPGALFWQYRYWRRQPNGGYDLQGSYFRSLCSLARHMLHYSTDTEYYFGNEYRIWEIFHILFCQCTHFNECFKKNQMYLHVIQYLSYKNAWSTNISVIRNLRVM